MTDIDPRGFVYQPPPAYWGSMVAADLWGSAREQWRAWYREQRLKLRGAVDVPIKGEFGRKEGLRFFDGPIVHLGFTLSADVIDEVLLSRARMVLGIPVVNVLISQPPNPDRFDVDQVFKFEAPRALPPPRFQRDRRDRPAHERIAAQRTRKPKPWRKTR